jgi:hypothetical protein
MKEEEKLWKNELDALLGKLVDDGLTVADKARLNEILQTEPEARELYHEYLDLHGALGERLGIPDFSSLNAVIDPETKEESKPVSILFGSWGWAAAAAVVIGLFIQFFLEQEETEPELSIAQITKLSGPLLWTGDGGQVNRNLKAGSELFGGTIEGMAPDAWFELEFNDGSQVVISGNSMLTISDLGQKELRLREGSFSANVVPQPEGKPMLVSTRTALFEVMGTRFSVDAELSSSTLTVNEGKVRATRLSDGSTEEVSAKYRVVVAVGRELVPEHMPESVTLWQSHLENGRKRNHGEWMPANGSEPAHLKAVPYTLPAKTDRKQRTIYTLSMPVSSGDHPPVVLQPETKIRVRGRIASSHRIWFGMTLSRENGDFAGRFQTILPAEEFKSGGLQAGAGQPAGKPRPEVEKPEKPDPRVEEYRKLEKWLEGNKAEAAKAERDLEVKIAELRKNPDKNEVEIGIKKARSEHNAKMAGHAGERKNLEDRLAELKEPFEVVLNLSDYHLDPSLSKWAEHLPKTPYGLIVKGIWCHTLWDPAGLQVSEMALTTPTDK